MKEPLSITHPELAAEWHPTKNGEARPQTTTRGSNKKVWWKCRFGHEWEATVANRAAGRRCPYCSNKKLDRSNCLATTHPDLAAEWHPTKNGDLRPENFTAGSGRRVWWKCPAGEDHEWEATINDRTHGCGCPICGGKRAVKSNCLAATHPDLAKEWHPTRNGQLTPGDVTAGSHRKVWWKCSVAEDHEWEAAVDARARIGSGCPCCANLKVVKSNCLATTHPDLAEQWHPLKNGKLTPADVVPGSPKKVWWKCPAAGDHEWVASIVSRTRLGSGCSCCAGLTVVKSNCLATTHPDLSKEWHPTKNGHLTPATVTAGSDRKVWWKCPVADDHEWEAPLSARSSGVGCPCCCNRQATTATCLSTTHPELAKEWHPIKNGSLAPDNVTAGSARKVWWKCLRADYHEWEAYIYSRTSGIGCPYCNSGWTLENIRLFVASLKEQLQAFTPAELYLLFQQNGLLGTEGRSRAFVKALATGRFPKEEIEKFVSGEPSLVDEFVQDPTQTLEALEAGAMKAETEGTIADDAGQVVEELKEGEEQKFPVVETKEVLVSLGLHVVTSADEEAVEFLLASAVAKIWKHAYQDEMAAVVQAEAFQGEAYAEQVRSRFLNEYQAAKGLAIPAGYAFQVKGEPAPPNLMQRHFAIRVRDRKRVGNWSGTGAGKTLAAVLATRVVVSKLTVICCPNSVVEGWREAILGIFADSMVAGKTFDPDWSGPASGRKHRYLILNYEAFQQPDSAERVRGLVEREPIDFIIVDEIHYAKQRAVENVSERRKMVAAMTSLAAERNPDLHVLGMSATPVINNLQEGKSMVELVTGLAHDDLDTRATVPNCMKLHQRLLTLGIRWMPDYRKMLGYECREERVEVDCGGLVEEIRALGKKSTPLALEQILTRVRLPAIRQHVRPKTLIYTYYIDGIDRLLRDALIEDGWKVGFYTGDDKTGKDAFIKGDLDVLIATAAIGTGVDGLQLVCNRLIINVLPWTRAEYDQLLGRIYRQGQVSKEEVAVIIPLTFAMVNGQRWSWCESKMQRLAFKKSIADAAVDGVVPEGHLRSPAQALQDVMAWLERLESGKVEVITRTKIVVPLPDTDPADVKRRQRRYGDFSAMNRTWNQSKSETTHQRLQANPEEWAQYHTLYREARKDWAVVPYEELIRWCRQRSGYVIGDFGCGEAKLAEAVSGRHTVHSFDHVAINENVVACDMAHVPLDAETLDVAIFSLSLMGANFAEYLDEAYRTLKLDGHLHIIEATSRFTDRERFIKALKELGFGGIDVADKWKFTHIHARKTENRPKGPVEIRF